MPDETLPVEDNGGTPEGEVESQEQEVANESPELSNEEKKSENSAPKGEVDPSFNCLDCKGEGLKSETEVCPTCRGTGKV